MSVIPLTMKVHGDGSWNPRTGLKQFEVKEEECSCWCWILNAEAPAYVAYQTTFLIFLCRFIWCPSIQADAPLILLQGRHISTINNLFLFHVHTLSIPGVAAYNMLVVFACCMQVFYKWAQKNHNAELLCKTICHMRWMLKEVTLGCQRSLVVKAHVLCTEATILDASILHVIPCALLPTMPVSLQLSNPMKVKKRSPSP